MKKKFRTKFLTTLSTISILFVKSKCASDRKWNLPLCCRTLGWKSRFLRGLPSFFDIDRSFGAITPDVIVIIAASLVANVVVVVVNVVAVVGGDVGTVAGERHRRRRVIDVRRPRMDRKCRRLRPRRTAGDRASGTDAPLGPR